MPSTTGSSSQPRERAPRRTGCCRVRPGRRKMTRASRTGRQGSTSREWVDRTRGSPGLSARRPWAGTASCLPATTRRPRNRRLIHRSTHDAHGTRADEGSRRGVPATDITDSGPIAAHLLSGFDDQGGRTSCQRSTPIARVRRASRRLHDAGRMRRPSQVDRRVLRPRGLRWRRDQGNKRCAGGADHTAPPPPAPSSCAVADGRRDLHLGRRTGPAGWSRRTSRTSAGSRALHPAPQCCSSAVSASLAVATTLGR